MQKLDTQKPLEFQINNEKIDVTRDNLNNRLNTPNKVNNKNHKTIVRYNHQNTQEDINGETTVIKNHQNAQEDTEDEFKELDVYNDELIQVTEMVEGIVTPDRNINKKIKIEIKK